MTRLRGTRAASTSDARVTEVMNGKFVSKPVKANKESEIIDPQEYARSGKAAASVESINKVKEITDFISRGN